MNIIQEMGRNGRSLLISPEGRRREGREERSVEKRRTNIKKVKEENIKNNKNLKILKTGNLLPFKKGPFHVAKNSGLRIIPIIFVGGQRLMGIGKAMCESGTLFITYLNPIYKETYQNMTIDEFKDYTEKYFEDNYEFKSDEEVFRTTYNNFWLFGVFLFEICSLINFLRFI